MTGQNSQNDLHVLADSYSQLSKDQLLIELERLIEPARFKDEPSEATRKREGGGLWRRIRKKVAVVICKDRQAGGNESINSLIMAGAGAFIEEEAKIIIGTGILPGVTAAVAAAVAALLYHELQKGVDVFCEAYYSAEGTD
ncbi:MAG TPA: hypothetical protein VLW65_23110 [Bryobacteraceae bacterium]|nr:hypothetical protein [Bryobacteraceae bacterium]